MHWIQTIRAHLKINQEELAAYLGVSLHTLQSVEQGRRNLPRHSLRPALIVFQAVIASRADDSTDGLTYTAGQQTQRKRVPYGQYHRALARCERRLEAMQDACAKAIINLGVYQHIAQSLEDHDDPVRKKWTERKIAETAKQVTDNDTGAQSHLHVQIDVLKGITRAIEQRYTGDRPTGPYMTNE